MPTATTTYSRASRTASIRSRGFGVPIDAPGNRRLTRVIRITNIRANACLLGVSSTLIPTQIIMYISVNGSQQVTINNPQQTVAFIQPGLWLAAMARLVPPVQQPQCWIASGNSGIGRKPDFNVTATEGFASSFKSALTSL